MREITNEEMHSAHFATWIALLLAVIALLLAANNYFAINRLENLEQRVNLLIDQADARLDDLESSTSRLEATQADYAAETTVENSATIVSPTTLDAVSVPAEAETTTP